MAGINADKDGPKTVEEYRAAIQSELETKGGSFAYNDEGAICVRRTIDESNAVYLPIDLDDGTVDDPTQALPYTLRPEALQALRDEVGWEPPRTK